MEVYNSFAEKQEIYNHLVIKDINEFINEVKKYEIRYFFRGMQNASYKMFSSMQRCWDGRRSEGFEISLDLLSKEIMSRFNNSPVIMEAFRNETNPKVYKSELAKWAFIQHFGGPSHLVDFTHTIETALFFAIPKKEDFLKYTKDEEDLNNYISIYLYRDNPFVNGNINMVYESGSLNGRKAYVEAMNNHPGLFINATDVNEDMYRQPLDPLFWGASVYGSEIFNISDIITGTVIDASLENAHILRQDGNFFQANLKEMIPLELAPKLRGAYTQEGVEHYMRYGICFDIHKSLIPDIKNSYKIPDETQIYTSDDYLAEVKKELKQFWKPLNENIQAIE